MNRRVHLLCFLCLAAAAAAQNVADPCTNYALLDGQRRQSQVVTDVNKATPICDNNLTPGWYRFTPGSGEVATSKVSKLHCGTVSPIWMDDTLPAPGAIVKKKFCFNNQDLSPTGCLWSIQAPIKNCGTFIVYKLPLQSTLCPMAMCTATVINCGGFIVYKVPLERTLCRTDASVKPCPPGQVSQTGFKPCISIPCPPGKWSPSGFEPCSDPYPKVTKVTLSGPDELLPGEFKHVCRIISSDTENDAHFKVTWSMNGVPVSHEILTGQQREAFFKLRDWEGHINQKLTCSVQAYYEHNKNHTSKGVTSNSYFGGIKIEPTPLTVVEGTDKKVEVISTLPLNCEEPSQYKSCQLNLHTLSPNLYTVGSCTLTFTPTYWNPTTHEARLPLEIASVVDPAVKPATHTHLAVDLSYNKSVIGLEMWGNKTQFSFEVLVTDEKLKGCVWSGDPHNSESFSYKGRYNLYHQGDFNMASDMRGPIAVQIETNTVYQPTHWPMISGLAVQTGSDDVTIIDTYGGSKRASVTSRRVPTTHRVQTCGTNEIQISTPTGHRLNIFTGASAANKHGFYLNVQAHFPAGIVSMANISNYINVTYEVCDVNATTKGQNTFGKSKEISSKIIDLFRTLPSQNLFKGNVLQLPKTPPKQYCSCSQANPGDTVNATCSSGMKVNDPMVKRSSCKDIQPTIITAPPSQRRPGEQNFKNYQPLPRRWPTPSGITENQARTKCRQDIINFAPRPCATIKDLNIEEIVDSCAEDVLASNGFGYVGGAVQAYKSKCETAILSNPANYKKGTDGNLGVPDILADQCPNMCNMQGACVHGVCKCQAGWEWEDCSVKSGEPFHITGIQGGILCDKSISDSCFKPVLNVENLGDVTGCSVDTESYQQGRPRIPGPHLRGIHQRESSYSVSCNFAEQVAQTDFHARMFRINIAPKSSNQDTMYTDYVVFDGVCQKCLEDLTCFMKEDACLIDGKCHKAGDFKMLNTRVECDPKTNMDGWTIKENVGNVPVSIGRK